MTSETASKIVQSEISNAELITHFREKCKICGHHRIMHNELGKCEGAGLQLCPPGPQEVSWMMMRAHCTVLQTVFVDGEKEKVILFFRSRW